MDVLIRPVREDDASSIVELLNPIIRAGTLTAIGREITVDEQRAFIRALPDDAIYLAAECTRTGCVVGIQDVLPASPAGSGEVSTFVAMDTQRRGVGAALTAAMLAMATTRGYARLVATIRADNPGAVTFYGRQGFDVVATTRDTIVAERRLGATEPGADDAGHEPLAIVALGQSECPECGSALDGDSCPRCRITYRRIDVGETRPSLERKMCHECGYALRGLPVERCPECAAPIAYDITEFAVDDPTPGADRGLDGLAVIVNQVFLLAWLIGGIAVVALFIAVYPDATVEVSMAAAVVAGVLWLARRFTRRRAKRSDGV